MDLGDTLKRMRKRLGKTQEEFASLVGCRHHTISRYEAGKIVPSGLVLAQLYQLADTVERSALERALKARTGPKFMGTGSAEAFVATVESAREVIRRQQSLLEGVSSKKQGAGFTEFATVAAFLFEECDYIDQSIIEILRLWTEHSRIRKHLKYFRDAAAFLRVQLGRTDRRLPNVEQARPETGSDEA